RHQPEHRVDRDEDDHRDRRVEQPRHPAHLLQQRGLLWIRLSRGVLATIVVHGVTISVTGVVGLFGVLSHARKLSCGRLLTVRATGCTAPYGRRARRDDSYALLTR